MCGINGILRLSDAAPAIERDELLRTRDAMTARGPDGFLYPWGNTFEQKGNNSAPMPGQEVYAVPVHSFLVVDQMLTDKSPYGVYGMAGNVSEWTDTVAPGRISSIKVPVVRGASFKTNGVEFVKLTYRNLTHPFDDQDFKVGFRCVSDTPPPAK